MSEPTHAGADHRHQVHLADIPGYATVHAAGATPDGSPVLSVDAGSGSANGPDFDGTNHTTAAHYLEHRGQRYSAHLRFVLTDGEWLPLGRTRDAEGREIPAPVAVDSVDAWGEIHRPLGYSPRDRAPKTYAIKMLAQVRDAVAAWGDSDAGRLAIAEERTIRCHDNAEGAEHDREKARQAHDAATVAFGQAVAREMESRDAYEALCVSLGVAPYPR